MKPKGKPYPTKPVSALRSASNHVNFRIEIPGIQCSGDDLRIAGFVTSYHDKTSALKGSTKNNNQSDVTG